MQQFYFHSSSEGIESNDDFSFFCVHNLLTWGIPLSGEYGNTSLLGSYGIRGNASKYQNMFLLKLENLITHRPVGRQVTGQTFIEKTTHIR